MGRPVIGLVDVLVNRVEAHLVVGLDRLLLQLERVLVFDNLTLILDFNIFFVHRFFVSHLVFFLLSSLG